MHQFQFESDKYRRRSIRNFDFGGLTRNTTKLSLHWWRKERTTAALESVEVNRTKERKAGCRLYVCSWGVFLQCFWTAAACCDAALASMQSETTAMIVSRHCMAARITGGDNPVEKLNMYLRVIFMFCIGLRTKASQKRQSRIVIYQLTALWDKILLDIMSWFLKS